MLPLGARSVCWTPLMMESLCAENPIKISRKASNDWNMVEIWLSTDCTSKVYICFCAPLRIVLYVSQVFLEQVVSHGRSFTPDNLGFPGRRLIFGSCAMIPLGCLYIGTQFPQSIMVQRFWRRVNEINSNALCGCYCKSANTTAQWEKKSKRPIKVLCMMRLLFHLFLSL